MLWIILAVLGAWALVALGRGPGRGKAEGYRLLLRLIGGVCLASGAVMLVRGGPYLGLPLLIAGLWLTTAPPEVAIKGAVSKIPSTRQQALKALGLTEGASRSEILAAHRRLIRASHPDQGGDTDTAARLNAARDILLGR